MPKKRKRKSLGDLSDKDLPPNVDRPEMWTTQDIVRAVKNGYTFMIPFVLGDSIFSQNAYWIAGRQYGSMGFTVGPDHTPEMILTEPDQWIRAKAYFPPELVPEKAWLTPPNQHRVVEVYIEIDPDTIDWDVLNRGYQIRVHGGF